MDQRNVENLKTYRFVFVSNYLNHHQIPFCRAMNERLDGSFVFIQTEPMEEERLRMGWNGELEEPYLKLYYEKPAECDVYIRDADILLFGGTDDERYVQERLKSGKPVLRYSERIYKTGQWKAVSPKGLRRKYLDHTRWRKSPVWLLCSGAYVPSDFHIIRAYVGKMFCWGYFPETKYYDLEELMAKKGYLTADGRRIPYLLWSGRMIDWKHPELAIEVAKYLKSHGLEFHLDLIGGGDLEDQLKTMVTKYGLGEQVSFLGFQKPEEVRRRMEKADVYLITSDRQEGWGAVANEAMNSGCAVVADHMIGAAPYLIRHGKNGYLYRDGDPQMLFKTVESLIRDEDGRKRLGRAAYETIRDTWNAENAAKSLCRLIERLTGILLDAQERKASPEEGEAPKAGDKMEFAPCEPAPVISERKMFRHLTEKNRT